MEQLAGAIATLTLCFLMIFDVCIASPTNHEMREDTLKARVPLAGIPSNIDMCKLDLIETRTCEPADSNLYARFRLEGPNQLLFHETPSTLTTPGLPINEKKPLQLKEWTMDYTFNIIGRPRDDNIQFQYGFWVWTTDTKEGFAKCRLITDEDWDKPGNNCRVDSRHFECQFPCEGV